MHLWIVFLVWNRSDSRFAPNQWETALLCNVSHWLCASLESALMKQTRWTTGKKRCCLSLDVARLFHTPTGSPTLDVKHFNSLGCSGLDPRLVHDDVIKWKHFPRCWPYVRGIHRSPVNSPHKGQWRGSLIFSLICAWTNGWVNNRQAGDSRRYRAHYDVIVMPP